MGFRRTLLPLLCLLVFTGCRTNPDQPPVAVESGPSAEATASDTLKLLYWQAPTILNPHFSTGFKDSEASRITLEPLASFDADGKLVLFLAAAEPSLENGGVAADGKSVTWQLKPDIKWSDGTPFTAEDVAFTYQFLTNPEVATTTAAVYENIAAVEALDPTTVKITFKTANPAWYLVFTGTSGMILPKHLFQGYLGVNGREAPANRMPVGTGPYRVVDFRPGDAVVYEPNPYYRQVDRLGFSRIELKGGRRRCLCRSRCAADRRRRFCLQPAD